MWSSHVAHAAPTPVIDNVLPSPVIEHIAPAPSVTHVTPSEQFSPAYNMMACAGIDLKCSGGTSLGLSTDNGGSNSSDAGGSSVSDSSPIRDESYLTSCDGLVSEQDGVIDRPSAPQILNSRMLALPQESLELVSYQRAGNEALPAGVAQGIVSVENLIE